MKKVIALTIGLLIPLGLTTQSFASPLSEDFAAQLYFETDQCLYGCGDNLSVDLFADISDPIFGFSFDLSFDGGTSVVSGPGDSGSYLTFTGFDVNTILFDSPLPPLFDDGDTISGEVDMLSPLVSGNHQLLGTFNFYASDSGPLGPETLYLLPPAADYGMFGVEGLLGTTALMPNNPMITFFATDTQCPITDHEPGAGADPIPEPATMLLFSTGLMGLAGFRRKIRIAS